MELYERASATAGLGETLGIWIAGAGCGGGRTTLIPAPPAVLDDTAIGRVLAGTELLAIDFYDRAASVPGLHPAESGYLRAAAANERAHHAAIALVLGAAVPHRLRFAYPPGTFSTPASVIRTGVVLEQAALSAYLGAVSQLRDPALRSLAARVAANEAQHLQDLTSLRDPGPGASISIPAVLTAREAASIVAPFLA